MGQKIVILVIFCLCLIFVFFKKPENDFGKFLVKKKTIHEASVDHLVNNPLDGCVFVYLDMGTNTGQQIR